MTSTSGGMDTLMLWFCHLDVNWNFLRICFSHKLIYCNSDPQEAQSAINDLTGQAYNFHPWLLGFAILSHLGTISAEFWRVSFWTIGKWLGNRQIRCNWATKGVGSNEDKQNSDNQNAVVLTNGSSGTIFL